MLVDYKLMLTGMSIHADYIRKYDDTAIVAALGMFEQIFKCNFNQTNLNHCLKNASQFIILISF